MTELSDFEHGLLVGLMIGEASFGGDGKAATSAQLNFPRNLALDVAGNLFVADANNRRIRRIGTDGIITTVVEFGCFVQILAVAVDGLLHLDNLRDDEYVMEDDGHAWTGRRRGRFEK